MTVQGMATSIRRVIILAMVAVLGIATVDPPWYSYNVCDVNYMKESLYARTLFMHGPIYAVQSEGEKTTHAGDL